MWDVFFHMYYGHDVLRFLKMELDEGANRVGDEGFGKAIVNVYILGAEAENVCGEEIETEFPHGSI